ncbi:unnamed protein product [Moneuplotes crassus]|uniref:Phosphoglycerate dehydrogenase n=1 Tax=Euplotes crassus TaxID=5936 RepID=A0AAD1XGI8_EUPCR|nr:unnamed protein product [Moneuplotes crassus]
MILICDVFSQEGIRTLVEAGYEVVYNKDLSGESLVEEVKNLQPEVLVVRSTKVTQSVIDANSNLKVIIRAGAGTDTIDVAYASEKDICVANCPGKNATAVAELAMGLIINIDRRLAENYLLQKEGKWRKGMFAKCQGLKGRTLGLIGFGNISQKVAQRALAFEMKVITYDVVQKDTEGIEFASSIDEVLEVADIVSLHVPNLPTTKGMVNAEFLAKMKENAVLINTARGEIINEEDLALHLETNNNFWYGTDVLKGEPSSKECDWEHPLSLHPRVYGSHHIGASTKQAEAEIGEEVVRISRKYMETGEIDDVNLVNKALLEKSITLVIRAKKGARSLADIYTTLESNEWEVTQTESVPCKSSDSFLLKIVGDGPRTIESKLSTMTSVEEVTIE